VNIGSGRSGEGPRGIWQKRPKNQPAWVFPLQDPAGTGVPILENHLHDFPESWILPRTLDFRGGHAGAFRKNSLKKCRRGHVPGICLRISLPKSHR